MQLLESRLLDTFFRNLDCSTEKCHLLNRKKYAVRVPHVNFEQLIKKVHLLEFSSRWQNFCDSKKKNLQFFSYRKDKMHMLDKTCTAYFFDFRADWYIFVICSNGVEQSRFWCRTVFSSRWISSSWPFSSSKC
jgi:hypothetical protein